MSMYLPNDDVEPTGEEAAEFIAEPELDAPAEDGSAGAGPPGTGRHRGEPSPDPGNDSESDGSPGSG